MPNFDIIAFDLDGTIYASPVHPVMSPRVEATLRAAHDAGIVTAVASGRPTGVLGSHVKNLDFIDWHITVNGAMVSDARTGNIISERPIPKDSAIAAIEAVKRACGDAYNGWNLFAYGAAHFERIVVERSRQAAERAAALGRESFSFVDSALADGSDIRIMDSILDAIDVLPGGIDKLSVRFDSKEVLDHACTALNTYEGAPLEIAYVGPKEVEITLAGVGKGSALAQLCEHLDIDERRSVAFGDSGNDVTFAQSACTFVAMGNATPEVKEIADDIAPNVKEDGVAVWLEQHLGL